MTASTRAKTASLLAHASLALLKLGALVSCSSGHCRRLAFDTLGLVSHWPVVQLTKLLVARPRPALFEPLIALPADGSLASNVVFAIAANPWWVLALRYALNATRDRP